MDLQERILEELKKVIDPELNINVVDLGLIYGVAILENGHVTVTMTLTTPGCPLHDSISSGVKYCLLDLEEVNDVDVQIVWEPAWSPEKMSDDAKRMLGFA